MTLEHSKPQQEAKKKYRRSKQQIAGDILLILSNGPRNKTSIFGVCGISWESKHIFDELLVQGLIVKVPGSEEIDGRQSRNFNGQFCITEKGKEALAHQRVLNLLIGKPDPFMVKLGEGKLPSPETDSLGTLGGGF